MEYKTGTYAMGRCTIVVTKTKQENWQLIIACDSNTPSKKEVAKARYKYLPNDIVMAQLFSSIEDYNSIPDNIIILVQIIK